MKIVKAMYFTEAADDAPVVKIPVLHMICLAVLAIPVVTADLLRHFAVHSSILLRAS